MDVNEAPVFTSSHYSTALPEGTASGTVLNLDLQALDGDEVRKFNQAIQKGKPKLLITLQGSNAELSYSIQHLEGLRTQNGTMVAILEPFFTIHTEDGAITLNTSLERESALYGFHYYEIMVSYTRTVTYISST